MALSDFNIYNGVVSQMESSIKAGRVSHAYIIEGSTESGKFELAINFIKAILCKTAKGVGCDSCESCTQVNMGNYQDLHILKLEEGKSAIVVSQVENLMDELSKKSFEKDGYKFVIIKDADKMNKIAQNKILKTLEEPFEKTVIILLSENDNHLLQTIRSRCITYRLNENQINSLYGQEAEHQFACKNTYDGRDKTDIFGAETKKKTKTKKTKEKDEDIDFEEIAKELIRQRARRKPIYVSLDYIDENVKNKQDGEELLNELTILYRNFLVGNMKSPFTLDKVAKSIMLIEEARKDLKYNVRCDYALKTLILKIGG